LEATSFVIVLNEENAWYSMQSLVLSSLKAGWSAS